LYDAATIDAHYVALLEALRPLGAVTYILGLIGPDEDCFPGSAAQFATVNARLRAIARSFGAEFIDWAADAEFQRDVQPWRCRDGFHPTREGAQILARILRRRLHADVPHR
jgi:lysophospholipase L1-like esterase